MAVFFISDTHFGDHRVLNLYPRPFESVADMDTAMIERWNATVAAHDEVWHVGAFARSAALAAEILPRLNGRKHLILGNNDPLPQPAGRESIAPYAEVRIDGTDLVLCHYPFRHWKGMDRGSINLHGHSHGRSKPLPRQFDVGADVRDFRPVTLIELLPSAHQRRRLWPKILRMNAALDPLRRSPHFRPADLLASASQKGFCARGCRCSSQRPRTHRRPKTGHAFLLHERLNQSTNADRPIRQPREF